MDSAGRMLEEEILNLSLSFEDSRSSISSPRTIKRPTNPVAACLDMHPWQPPPEPAAEGERHMREQKRPRLESREYPQPPPFAPASHPHLSGFGGVRGGFASPGSGPSPVASAGPSPVRAHSFSTMQPNREDLAEPEAMLASGAMRLPVAFGAAPVSAAPVGAPYRGLHAAGLPVSSHPGHSGTDLLTQAVVGGRSRQNSCGARSDSSQCSSPVAYATSCMSSRLHLLETTPVPPLLPPSLMGQRQAQAHAQAQAKAQAQAQPLPVPPPPPHKQELRQAWQPSWLHPPAWQQQPQQQPRPPPPQPQQSPLHYPKDPPLQHASEAPVTDWWMPAAQGRGLHQNGVASPPIFGMAGGGMAGGGGDVDVDIAPAGERP